MKGDRFPLGTVFVTRGANDTLTAEETMDALCRHATGDWGSLDHDDQAANDRALADGSRLLSRYLARTGKAFWIITEADRSATTVLLPEEY